MNDSKHRPLLFFIIIRVGEPFLLNAADIDDIGIPHGFPQVLGEGKGEIPLLYPVDQPWARRKIRRADKGEFTSKLERPRVREFVERVCLRSPTRVTFRPSRCRAPCEW